MKELVPLIAAAIGLTPVFLKWINDRSNAAANLRSIQFAKEQIEFWEIWLKAKRKVTSDEKYEEIKTEVSKQLDELKLRSTQDSSENEDPDELEQGPLFLQRIFLLYFPHTPAGWILHTIFYIIVSFSVFFTFVTSLTEDGTSEWAQLKTELGYVIPVLLIFLLIAFILQRNANRAEKRYLERRKEAKQKADS